MTGNNQYTNPYTEEQLSFLNSYRDSNLSYLELSRLFNDRFKTNKSKSSICCVCVNNLKFKQRKKTPHKLTEEQLNFIENNYRGISRNELARLFNEQFHTDLSPSQIKQICNLRGWNNGLTGKFGTRPDYVPWNKNLTKEEFYSHYDLGKDTVAVNIRNAIATNTHYHVGDIFIRKGQKFICVEEPNGKKWMNRVTPLVRYVWEQNNGPIPPGHKIICKDGNYNNCELSNLLCVNKQTIMELAKNDCFGSGEITEATVEISIVKQKIKQVSEEASEKC